MIPSALRMHSNGEGKISVHAATVAEALHEAACRHGSLMQHILTRDGRLRPFVNIFVRHEDVRHLDGLGTRLHEGDTVMIVPSVAGG